MRAGSGPSSSTSRTLQRAIRESSAWRGPYLALRLHARAKREIGRFSVALGACRRTITLEPGAECEQGANCKASAHRLRTVLLLDRKEVRLRGDLGREIGARRDRQRDTA